MRLEGWVHGLLRKLPRNFEGRLIWTFKDGQVMTIERQDVFDEGLFRDRFREYAKEEEEYLARKAERFQSTED